MPSKPERELRLRNPDDKDPNTATYKVYSFGRLKGAIIPLIAPEGEERWEAIEQENKEMDLAKEVKKPCARSAARGRCSCTPDSRYCSWPVTSLSSTAWLARSVPRSGRAPRSASCLRYCWRAACPRPSIGASISLLFGLCGLLASLPGIAVLPAGNARAPIAPLETEKLHS